MSEATPYKRRNIFIHRAFQGRFIAWMLGMIVIFGVCSAILMYVLLSSDLENETRTMHLRITDTWQKLGFSIIVSNVVSALFAGLSVVVVVMYISHKIAGPMYRFQKICGEVAKGNLDVHAHLRDKDQLQELANAFGDMVESLKERRRAQEEAILDIHELVEQMRREIDSPELMRRSLDTLASRLGSLQTD